MSDSDVRNLVILGIALVIYQVVLGPIVMALVRDYLRTRREKRLDSYSGRHGKGDE
jgi:hypothetical protein